MKRAASEELGEGDWAITYNRNGRPVRKSAGKKTPDPDFVQAVEEEQLSDYFDEDPISSDDEPEEFADVLLYKRKAKKQKRAHSPTPPPLSPLPPLDVSSERSSPSPVPMKLDHVQQCFDFEPINLTFNIAPGFSGPLHVKLDLSNVPLRAKRRQLSTGTDAVAKSEKVLSLAIHEEKKGFLSFPPGKSYEIVVSTHLTCHRITQQSVPSLVQR